MYASALSPSLSVVGQFFHYFTFPLLLRLAVHIYYVFWNMPTKWSSQIAPGTKFLRLLGSLCARAHPENHYKISDTKEDKTKEENIKMWLNIINVWCYPSKYILIDWLIDTPRRHFFCQFILPNSLQNYTKSATISFEHGFDSPPLPLWTMFKKTDDLVLWDVPKSPVVLIVYCNID